MQYYILLAVLLCGMLASILAKKLTVSAALTGGVTAFLVFMGAGWAGILMMTVFFVLGTLSTSWRHDIKERFHIAEAGHGRRKASQVLANSGTAALMGLFGWMTPAYTFLAAMLIACCFSSATADTMSSELGSVYGKRFYNILTFKKDKRGLDGVVSLEGTMAGLAGSIVIASIYAFAFGWNRNFIGILIAGTIGNLTDSILGATVERKGVIGNDVVNFLNTAIAAAAGYLYTLI